MPTLRMVLGGCVVASLFVFTAASPAVGSCAAPLPLSEAVETSDVVVVGIVSATRSADRIATVAVEDIWKGDTEPSIEVAGGPEQPNAATSVDRVYEVGTRYLFFILEPARHPSSPAGTFPMQYTDNNCSNTQPYTSDLDQHRPVSARKTSPAQPPPTSSSPVATARASDDRNAEVVVLAIAALGVCVGLVSVVWRARRRPSPAAP